jgi:hypothetical protein
VVPAMSVAGQHVADDELAERSFTSFAAAVACKSAQRGKEGNDSARLGEREARVIQHRGTCAPASGVESG